MDFIGQLWQPILLSAALVFIASAMSWTMLPFHNKEFKGLPDADGVRDLLKKAGFEPGQYMFPFTEDAKERRSPGFMAKFAEGPSGMVTIMPRGPMSMGGMMTKSVIFNIVVSFFAAYVAHHAFLFWPTKPTYLQVFQVVGAVGFMSYGFGTVMDSIWFARPWKSWLLVAADALVFGMLMGGTFGWLWPR